MTVKKLAIFLMALVMMIMTGCVSGDMAKEEAVEYPASIADADSMTLGTDPTHGRSGAGLRAAALRQSSGSARI